MSPSRFRAGALASLLGLIIACNFVLKPVRSALFLTRLGADQLPYVYLVAGMALGVVAVGFGRAIARRNLHHVFLATTALFSSNLLLFWWLFPQGGSLLPYVFYLWVSVFIVAMPSLFWLLANYVLYPHEAKRTFGTITAGGILGSILGGGLTSAFVSATGTRGLLLVAMLMTAGVGALASWIWWSERDRIAERLADVRHEGRRHAGKRQSAIPPLGGSSYLWTIAALTAVTGIASTLVDFQFNDVAEHAFSGEDALAGFFGTFLAAVNVVALFLQVFLAGRIVQRLGVGSLLLFLPLTLMAGAAAVFARPSLWTAALLMASDGCFSNSFHRSGIEILYLPLPLETKARVKTSIDMIVDRAGRAVAGLVILGGTRGLGLPEMSMSVVLLVLVVPWLYLTATLARRYVEAFRDSLARRDIDVSALTAEIRDPAGIAVLSQALSGSDERQLLYSLDLVKGAVDPSLERSLRALLRHASPRVRVGALRSLRGVSRLEDADAVRELSKDLSPRVRAEAFLVLMKNKTAMSRTMSDGEAGLVSMLSGSDRDIDAVLDCLYETPEMMPGFRATVEGVLSRFAGAEADTERLLAARAAGLVPDSSGTPALVAKLLSDASLPVAKAAAVSASKLPPSEIALLLPSLLDALARPELRAAAWNAIARCGDPAIDLLAARLGDTLASTRARGAAARALAEIESQRAVDELLACLPQEDPYLHYRVIKALGKMRARYPSLRFDRARIDLLLSLEALSAYEIANAIAAVGSRREPSFELLVRTLHEKQTNRVERLFRLLGLVHSPKDIFNAWYAVAHGSPTVRAAAIEFLENVLSSDHRAKTLPLVEAASPEAVIAAGRLLFAIPELNFTSALRRLVVDKDAWVSACAITVAGDLRLSALETEIGDALRNPHRAVREAAERARECVVS